MRIAFYLKHFPPLGSPLIGGTAVSVGGLVQGLLKLKQHVTVLCEAASDGEHATTDGCQIRSFATGTTSIPVAFSKRFREYLASPNEKPNLIIVNGCFRLSPYLVGRIARAHDIPYVAATHTNYEPALFQRKPYLKWPYWYLIEKRHLNSAKAIQLLDCRHANQLRRLGINNTFLTIPNGYSPVGLPCLASSTPTSNSIRLVFRGRIDPHTKGLDLLFLAVARLKNSYNLKVTIQGPDIGKKHQLTKLAHRLGLTSIISFLEPDYSPPYSFLSQHDIFCLPSRYEGFGISALEAMLAGRVMLVTNLAGIAPYIKRSGCGVLVEPNQDSIANGLRELISRKSTWKEMGLAGQQCVMAELNWTNIANKALIEYQTLCR